LSFYLHLETVVVAEEEDFMEALVHHSWDPLVVEAFQVVVEIQADLVVSVVVVLEVEVQAAVGKSLLKT
jgi:hypothetical protein